MGLGPGRAVPSGSARGVLAGSGLRLAIGCALCPAVMALHSPEAIAAGAHLDALGQPVHPRPGSAIRGRARTRAGAMGGQTRPATRLSPLKPPACAVPSAGASSDAAG